MFNSKLKSWIAAASILLAAINSACAGWLPLANPSSAQTDTGCSITSGTVTTFTAKNIGTANPNRVVVVTLNWSDSTLAGTAEITAVSVGGNAATRAVRALGDNQNSNSEIWWLPLSSGTSGNVVVTASTAVNGMTIALYSLIGYNNFGPVGVAVGTTSAVSAYSNKNLALAAGSRTTNVSTSLSNLTNDFSSACGSFLWGVHASGQLAGNNQTLTTTINPTSNTPEIALTIWGTTAVDPNFASVVLLMPFDGINGATSGSGLVDLSPSAHGACSITPSAALSTAQFQFGTSSIVPFNGSNGLCQFADSNDWQLGGASNSNQYTIEFWVRFTTLGTNQSFVGQYSVGTKAWAVFSNNTEFYFDWVTTGSVENSVVSSGAGLAINTPYVIAVDKDSGGTIRLYVNGVMITKATPADSSMINASTPLQIGAFGGGNAVKGFIDEIRLTKGIARYASDAGYTPAVQAFPLQ